MKPIRSLMRWYKKFAANEQGSVLMLFGLSVVILVAVAGVGVDLGRWQLTAAKLQQAADAASTSAAGISASGTVSRSDGTPVQQTDIINAGNRYFNLNYPLDKNGTRPTASTTLTGSVLTVNTSQQTTTTSFISNLDTKFKTLLTSQKNSVVNVSASATSDYDIAMIVDETGSTACNIAGTSCGGNERINAMKAAVTTMANNILPVTGPSNANVRMGFVGYSSHITNKWGLSYKNADALTAISKLRPTCNNYDYAAFYASINMLQGGTAGVANQQTPTIGPSDCTVQNNTTMPTARTARTNTANQDVNGISNAKIVVFLTDGGIMTDPAPCADTYDGRLGPPFGSYYECYNVHPEKRNFPQFTASCQAAKNINAHIYVINFASPAAGALTAMEQCASPTIAGGSTYSSTVKPDPTIDYYNAPDAATLNTIFTNITTQIKKIRIVQ